MLPESNTLGAVAVCGTKSLFRQTTRSPRRTVSVSGVKRMLSITTVWVWDAACAMPLPHAPASRSVSAQTGFRQASALAAFLSATTLAQIGFKLLGVLQMFDKCRTRLF